MTLNVLALVVSIIAAVAAALTVPAFQPAISSISPRFHLLINRYGTIFIVIFSCLTAIVLFVYLVFFRPCPWYRVDNLRSLATQFANKSQWSSVEDVGQQMCDCGASGEGWDVQAKSEYAIKQYRIAINFWKRSIVANPRFVNMRNASIADASIWLDDFRVAVDLYRKLYTSDPCSNRYRYGYGRALTFYGDYKEAKDILQGMPPTFNDGGTSGETQVFEGIARLGFASTNNNENSKNEEIDVAKQTICKGIKEDNQWKPWLFDKNSDVGHLSVFRPLIKLLPSVDCS